MCKIVGIDWWYKHANVVVVVLHVLIKKCSKGQSGEMVKARVSEYITCCASSGTRIEVSGRERVSELRRCKRGICSRTD